MSDRPSVSWATLSGLAETKATLTVLLGFVALLLARFILGTSYSVLGLLGAVLLALAKKLAAGPSNRAQPSLKGKIVLVTGGATGIGLETVRELARLGATCILAARGGPDRLHRAVEEARRGLKSSASITGMELDLASFASIHTFVQSFLAEHTRLHLLVNNAGVMACPYSLTEDGLEMQMGTNHFGHFLLTSLLMDTLVASRARVVNVSSSAHDFVPTLAYPRFNHPASYQRDLAYGDSKLANILFTRELDRRFGRAGVQACALHPGCVATQLMRHQTRLAQLLLQPIKFILFKSAWAGAQTTLHCALSSEVESGGYYADCRPHYSSPGSRDAHRAAWLWEESERVTKISS